eukprot:3133078-Rhodomonas_salina.1
MVTGKGAERARGREKGVDYHRFVPTPKGLTTPRPVIATRLRSGKLGGAGSERQRANCCVDFLKIRPWVRHTLRQCRARVARHRQGVNSMRHSLLVSRTPGNWSLAKIPRISVLTVTAFTDYVTKCILFLSTCYPGVLFAYVLPPAAKRGWGR